MAKCQAEQYAGSAVGRHSVCPIAQECRNRYEAHLSRCAACRHAGIIVCDYFPCFIHTWAEKPNIHHLTADSTTEPAGHIERRRDILGEKSNRSRP